MLSKTQGIVIHAIPYSDTRYMVHIYTNTFGRISCLAKRGGGRKNTMPKVLFMPLSIINIEIERRNPGSVCRLQEVELACPLARLFADPVKNAIALFIAEILFRTLKETGPDAPLFRFLSHSIRLLEDTEAGIANFHLAFLLRLLLHLGISPDINSFRESYLFDMRNGIFVENPPLHKHFLDKEESRIFAKLLRISYENMSLYTFSRHERVNILDKIITYYRLHMPETPEIKSLPILKSLFD
ncbi:MAG: DNA repair protein RecO [Tannerellaceae bacterium]|jgi:DNA repair protein RecO (recombination protein O)|nr:DNA repair protein RecO [Tannerellaceae bacterium]